MTLPDWRVEGAAPARQVSDSGVGKRPRASPISASSRAARTVPDLGSEVKIAASGWAASCSAIWSSSALIWARSAVSAATRARVMSGPGGGFGAGGAAGRVVQVVPEPVEVAQVVVADRAQPVLQPGAGEPVGLVLAGEAGQEPQGDRGVDVAEQPDRAGQGGLQVRAELVGHRDPGVDEVLAGPHGHPQGDGGVAVAGQRPEPGAVGAHGVGQDVGVEPSSLLPAEP